MGSNLGLVDVESGLRRRWFVGWWGRDVEAVLAFWKPRTGEGCIVAGSTRQEQGRYSNSCFCRA